MNIAPIAATPPATTTDGAFWQPLPELVGTRSVPWSEKTLIDTTADEAAASVVKRYDRNGDGRLDRSTENLIADEWSYWANADGSHFSGYTPPEHIAFVRTTRSIDDLLAAAAAVQAAPAPITATDIATVLDGFDTNLDGRLTWDDANGGTRMPQFFGDLTRMYGEQVVTAARIIS